MDKITFLCSFAIILISLQEPVEVMQLIYNVVFNLNEILV